MVLFYHSFIVSIKRGIGQLPVDFPTLPDGRKGRYDAVIVHWKDKWFGAYDYELVGWYADLDDVLKNCKIEGRPFSDVIMDDETEIIGKD